MVKYAYLNFLRRLKLSLKAVCKPVCYHGNLLNRLIKVIDPVINEIKMYWYWSILLSTNYIQQTTDIWFRSISTKNLYSN